MRVLSNLLRWMWWAIVINAVIDPLITCLSNFLGLNDLFKGSMKRKNANPAHAVSFGHGPSLTSTGSNCKDESLLQAGFCCLCYIPTWPDLFTSVAFAIDMLFLISWCNNKSLRINFSQYFFSFFFPLQDMVQKFLVSLTEHSDASLRLLAVRLDFNEVYKAMEPKLRSPMSFGKTKRIFWKNHLLSCKGRFIDIKRRLWSPAILFFPPCRWNCGVNLQC